MRPVGICGPSRTADGSPDFQAGNIDLDAVEVLGDFGEMDLELLVTLQPAVYVDPELYGGQLWYLGETVDQMYVASYKWMIDLLYFHDLGLDIVDHGIEDFFELLSWEQANKYPADLILVDARAASMTPEDLLSIETWASLPAVQAGQVGLWYAAAPYSHARLTPIMLELAELVRNSRADVV